MKPTHEDPRADPAGVTRRGRLGGGGRAEAGAVPEGGAPGEPWPGAMALWSAGDGPGTGPLAAADILLNSMCRQLTELVAEIDAGESDRARRLAPSLAEIRRAALVAHQERSVVQDSREKHRAAIGTPALDLADARAEIGRRLARLRRSGGAGRVSGSAH